MGRRDAVQVILEVVAECRRLLPALVVSYEPGWETRGNGTSANYDFGSWHHTASSTSALKPFPTQKLLRDGRVDLNGPLCNFAGPWCTVEQPRLHVMAANPANHAGASRASGPVPKLALFNPRTLGLEIDYAGSSPMTAGQALVAKVWGRAVAKVVGGGDTEHVRGHAETSVTGKWDPGYAPGKTIDLAAFRRDAAGLTVQEDDMPITDDEMNRIADKVWQKAQKTKGFGGGVSPIAFLEDTRVLVGTAIDGINVVAAKPDVAAGVPAPVSPEQLAAAIAAAIPDELADAVVAKLGQKLAS